MLASLIAERYSKALFRSARAENALPEVGRQAGILRQGLADSAVIASFLGDPLTEPSEKLKVLASVFNGDPHPVVRAFLAAVLENKRERFLPAILDAFAVLLDGAEGRVRATLTTARPLGPKELGLLQDDLSRRLGRTVVLLPFADKSLLGGAVLKVGDTVFDGSVRGGLERLGRRLQEGPTLRSKPTSAAKGGGKSVPKTGAGVKKTVRRAAVKVKTKSVPAKKKGAPAKKKGASPPKKAAPAKKKAAKKSQP